MVRTTLHMKFITGIAAISIALTGLSAVPARADNDDVAKVLGALVGIAVLGAIINDNRKDNDAHVTRQRHGAHPRVQPRIHKRPRPYADPKPRPLPRRFVLPNRCLRTVPLRNGQRVNAFGQGCLNKYYGHTNSLPRQCARADRANGQVIYSYGARCLRNQGYKLARR